jgi:hypothetical protein
MIWIFVMLLMTAAASYCGAGLRLNEIMADPASDWNGDGVISYRDDEWIEVVNTGPGVEDLTGCRIATADTAWRYEFTGNLTPGARVLVTGRMAYDWERATGEAAYGLRLGNEGDYVMLWRLGLADSLMLDSVRYRTEDAEDDRSTGRLPDGDGEWSLFDALLPVPPGGQIIGNGCAPTPAAVNWCETPVESETWGRIKRGYAE